LSVSADTTLPADADDAALMEIGVDLATLGKAEVTPLPTYTSTRPKNHEEGTIAKFPMLHEIKGIEAQDWSDIQGLLFREPSAATESNLDMKLDELEKKFNKIPKKPVPSGIAPAGSTLLPKIKKVELGLRATLPKQQQRLKQLKKALAKSGVKVAKKTAAAKKTVAKKAVAKKAATKKTAKKASVSKASAAVATVRLIEKRVKGLNTLVKRLKGQIGIDTPVPAHVAAKKSAARVDAALKKQRKADKDLKKRMAARKSRFAQVDLDSELDSEDELEAETDLEAAADVETQSFAETESDADSDADAEVESEQESESELALDAEAVEEIMSMM